MFYRSECKQLLGAVKAIIWASAPSPLFDIGLRLSDVDMKGNVTNIIDAFHRERIKNVNQAFRLAMEIGTTAYLLKKGHRLRLDVVASKAPLFDINLNNGTTTKTHTNGKTAMEHIYHGAETKSKINLPLTDI